jgi:outer membrane biosynthesis protein TonB
MRIKLLFLLAASLTLATGIPAQSPSGNESKTATTPQEDSALHLGSVSLLSDTQGVDFGPYLAAWHKTTQATWKKLIPQEAEAPTLRQGEVVIQFKILPNGRIMDGSMILEGRSGSVALDRAAWGALTTSKLPPLPGEFHGPYLALRADFLYNRQPNP